MHDSRALPHIVYLSLPTRLHFSQCLLREERIRVRFHQRKRGLQNGILRGSFKNIERIGRGRSWRGISAKGQRVDHCVWGIATRKSSQIGFFCLVQWKGSREVFVLPSSGKVSSLALLLYCHRLCCCYGSILYAIPMRV